MKQRVEKIDQGIFLSTLNIRFLGNLGCSVFQ